MQPPLGLLLYYLDMVDMDEFFWAPRSHDLPKKCLHAKFFCPWCFSQYPQKSMRLCLYEILSRVILWFSTVKHPHLNLHALSVWLDVIVVFHTLTNTSIVIKSFSNNTNYLYFILIKKYCFRIDLALVATDRALQR